MSKQTNTEKISVNKKIDKLVKAIAYIALVTFASYGLKAILIGVGRNVAYGFSAGITLLLIYLIFKND